MKYFRCPICRTIHSSENWDNETKIQFDIGEDDLYDNIESLDKNCSYYNCPNCHKEIDGIYINEIEIYKDVVSDLYETRHILDDVSEKLHEIKKDILLDNSCVMTRRTISTKESVILIECVMELLNYLKRKG